MRAPLRKTIVIMLLSLLICSRCFGWQTRDSGDQIRPNVADRPRITPQWIKDRLQQDLVAARGLIERGAYYEFIERYAPINDYRKARRSTAAMQEYARLLASGSMRSRLLELLDRLDSARVILSPDARVASFETVVAADHPSVLGKELAPLTTRDSKGRWSGDLDQFLNSAIQFLERDDANALEFFEHVLPPAELARWDRQPALKQQAVLSWNLVRSAMLRDFRLMKSTQFELIDEGQTAVCRLPVSISGQTGDTVQESGEREIRFQRTDEAWHFYDQHSRTHRIQQKMKPDKGTEVRVTLKLVMVRYGHRWRLRQIP